MHVAALKTLKPWLSKDERFGESCSPDKSCYNNRLYLFLTESIHYIINNMNDLEMNVFEESLHFDVEK